MPPSTHTMALARVASELQKARVGDRCVFVVNATAGNAHTALDRLTCRTLSRLCYTMFETMQLKRVPGSIAMQHQRCTKVSWEHMVEPGGKY